MRRVRRAGELVLYLSVDVVWTGGLVVRDWVRSVTHSC